MKVTDEDKALDLAVENVLRITGKSMVYSGPLKMPAGSTEYPHGGFVWQVIIAGYSMTYTKGVGHVYDKRMSWAPERPIPPRYSEVMHAWLLDASVGEMSFEDMCSEFGYDDDSMRAHSIWTQCVESRRALKRNLTTEQIEQVQKLLEDY